MGASIFILRPLDLLLPTLASIMAPCGFSLYTFFSSAPASEVSGKDSDWLGWSHVTIPGANHINQAEEGFQLAPEDHLSLLGLRDRAPLLGVGA